MYKIKTHDQIADAGLNQFSANFNVDPDHTDPDALLLRSHKLHDATLPTSLLAIARAGAGVNNIPVERCTELGIPVFNTPGANANAVKELVIASLLITSRNLVRAMSYVRSLADNPDVEASIEANKHYFVGHELSGKRLAVIGLGAIGVKVCNSAHHLGMQVKGFDPAISVARAWELDAAIQHADTIGQALQDADYISVHVPLNPQTRGLINDELLNCIKPGASLLNFSRAAIIDQVALLSALDHSLRFYVTDFANHELLRHDNVICLPHLGASTVEAEQNCAVMAADSLMKFLQYGDIDHSVNFPSVRLPLQSNCQRLAIINQNIPNMLGQISSLMAQHQLNIHDMLNQSRGRMAYTLLDIDGSVPAELLDALQAVEGIVRVRLIPPA